MFIDDLLLAVGVQHHGKIVKAGHGAPQLKAVDQKHGHADALLAGAGEENFLQIGFCLHIVCSFFLLADDMVLPSSVWN